MSICRIFAFFGYCFDLCKMCWPWWNAAICAILSGASLFEKVPNYWFPEYKGWRELCWLLSYKYINGDVSRFTLSFINLGSLYFIADTQALEYTILLTVPRRYFFCGSFVLFLSCVCHLSSLLLLLCGHLLGKSRPLGSCLWCLVVILSLSHVVSWVRCGTCT